MAINREENYVEFQGTIRRILFPKDCKTTEGKYIIAIMEVDKVVKGNVEYNPKSNFFPYSEKEVTIKGNVYENLEVGVTYKYSVIGVYMSDNKYGGFYQLRSMTTPFELTTVAQYATFLANVSTTAKAKLIVGEYNNLDRLKEIFENEEIEALTDIKGIQEKTARKIFQQYRTKKEKALVQVRLGEYGISPAMTAKLITRYKTPERALGIIKNHPYNLILDVNGIGFKTADQIALNNGLQITSYKRISGFISYWLTQAGLDGHSYITAGDLTSAIFTNLGSPLDIIVQYTNVTEGEPRNNIEEAIMYLQKKNIIGIQEHEDSTQRKIFLIRNYRIEEEIAEHLIRIRDGQNRFKYGDWREEVGYLEDKQGWQFTEEQLQGIQAILDNQLILVTGGGGVGKTSIVSGVLKVLRGYSFAQAALSGKAGARLQEVTGEQGLTIHRLLSGRLKDDEFEYSEKPLEIDDDDELKNMELLLEDDDEDDEDDTEKNYKIDAREKPADYLPQSIIIIDEISMVGGLIFLRLLQRIRTGTKLILLGDMGQLESIGLLNLAADMYTSDTIPKVTLTKIHRQAQKSGIITCAHKVRNKTQLTGDDNYESDGDWQYRLFGELEDMEVYTTHEPDLVVDKTLAVYRQMWDSDLVQQNIDNIQVVVPVTKRGTSSVEHINNVIQDFVNPDRGTDYYTVPTQTLDDINNDDEINMARFSLNDKVMCIKNNYRMKSAKDVVRSLNIPVKSIKVEDEDPWGLSDESEEVEVFNGWVGQIVHIDPNHNRVIIDFPLATAPVFVPFKILWMEYTLGYAATCHKLQGSSAKCIIAVLNSNTPPMMRTKELLYTMLTRAEKHCALISHEGTLRQTINTSFISTKKTFLPVVLKKYSGNNQ